MLSAGNAVFVTLINGIFTPGFFSEGAFPILFHDNPELVAYLTSGY